jgi:AcrR family transcriptional regulator
MSNSGRYGDETRRKLIAAGLDVFGRYGFETATTRMLAKAAGVNLAAIPYHFGGKEGLYQAVVESVAARILDIVAEKRKILYEVVKNPQASREEMLRAMEGIIRAFGRFLVSSEFGDQMGFIIIWEQFQPTAAFDRIYDSAMGELHKAVTCLVARLTDVSPESEEAILRTHAIIGQVFVFRAMRETAKRRLGWKKFDEKKTTRVCDILVENMRRILGKRR